MTSLRRLPRARPELWLWPLWLLLVSAASAQSPATNDGGSTEAATESETSGGVARIDLELDRDSITVGDRIRAELTLVWLGAEPSAEPRFPTWQETWGQAEVLDSSKIEGFTDGSGRRIYRQVLTLTSFEVGEVDLPSVVFAIPLGERTEEVRGPEGESFAVVSVLPKTEEEEAADPNDPTAAAPQQPGAEAAGEQLEPRGLASVMPLAGARNFPWVAGGFALALVLAAALLARRVRALPSTLDGATGVPARPLLAPYDELLATLDGVSSAAGSEPVHTTLSLALRRFLGRRLGFQAVESTTSEIQRRLHRSPLAGDETRETLELLRACDQVKFARLEVSEGVARDRLDRGRRLGERIERHFLPGIPVGHGSGSDGGIGGGHGGGSGGVHDGGPGTVESGGNWGPRTLSAPSGAETFQTTGRGYFQDRTQPGGGAS